MGTVLTAGLVRYITFYQFLWLLFFCVCREFTSQRWIPHTKASDVELWCFLWSAPWINGWVNNSEAGDLRCQCTHFDVIVMISMHFLLSRQLISKWFTRSHEKTALKISCPIIDINNISKPEKLAAVYLKRKCSVHLYRTTQLQWSFLPQDFRHSSNGFFFNPRTVMICLHESWEDYIYYICRDHSGNGLHQWEKALCSNAPLIGWALTQNDPCICTINQVTDIGISIHMVIFFIIQITTNQMQSSQDGHHFAVDIFKCIYLN